MQKSAKGGLFGTRPVHGVLVADLVPKMLKSECASIVPVLPRLR